MNVLVIVYTYCGVKANELLSLEHLVGVTHRLLSYKSSHTVCVIYILYYIYSHIKVICSNIFIVSLYIDHHGGEKSLGSWGDRPVLFSKF